jgi:hypothetical protein
MPLHLLVFDRTCTWLSRAWGTGAHLYRGLGRVDAALPVSSWDEALRWLGTHGGDEPIAEIQYWGHGRWGRVLVAGDALDAERLRPSHASFVAIERVRERLAPDARVWLRTCEAFGADAGHDFAMRLADTLGVRVAGHTFVIGAVQSGLRTLVPGARPGWSASEGLCEGTAARPIRAHGSSFFRPRTVTCFTNSFPASWFDEDRASRHDGC